MFVEALGQVYCGDLDRYVQLTGEVATRYGAERGYALAAYVDGLQSAGRIEEALALTEASVSAARDSGSPYWLTYSLWIAGMAFAHVDRRRALAAWDEGIAVVREHRVHFFEGFLARDAARLHTSDGEPDAALLLFSQAIEAFHRAGNVPQLVITIASVPALFEKLERFEPAATLFGAMSQQPSSLHHVPELADMERRLTAGVGRVRLAELIALGEAFELDDAAVYAREQIAVARREPTVPARPSRPGGLSRREVEVAPPRCHRSHVGRDRQRPVHLDAHRRAPHRQHLHEDRCLEPRLGDTVGGRQRHRRRVTISQARNGYIYRCPDQAFRRH